jgi:hypothetical protein
MPRGKTPRLLEDLDRFEQIARLLDQGTTSLRTIAGRLDPPVSVSAVTDCLKRLKERYGGTPLVTGEPKTASANALTAEGRTLYEALRSLRRFDTVQVLASPPPERAVRPLRIMASHSLVTSQLITPALENFLRERGHHVNFRLHLSAELVFSRVVDALLGHEVDLALLWGVATRLNEHPGITHELVGPEFDVVVISPDEARVRRIRSGRSNVPDLRATAAATVLTLGRANQPAFDLLPRPDIAAGGQRIELGTIDAIVACVRAGIGDYGLVPYIPSLLDPLLWNRLLFQSAPIARVRLALFMPKPGRPQLSEAAQELVGILEDYLHGVSTRSALRSRSVSRSLPPEAEFYRKLRFGYYVGPYPKEPAPPQWMWETVRAEPPTDADADAAGFPVVYRVRNLFGHEFRAEGQPFDRMFLVTAKRIDQPEGSRDETVSSFIAIFTWCAQVRGVLYGIWSGQDPEGNPVVYPELWSERPLELREICELGRQATIFSALNTDRGDSLDCPAYREAVGNWRYETRSEK